MRTKYPGILLAAALILTTLAACGTSKAPNPPIEDEVSVTDAQQQPSPSDPEVPAQPSESEASPMESQQEQRSLAPEGIEVEAELPAYNFSVYEENGLTVEENEYLRTTKAEFEAMSEEEQQVFRGNGGVGCARFIHLFWEETIAGTLIDLVGGNEFERWLTHCRENNECPTLYSYANFFGFDMDDFGEAIKGIDSLEELYPINQMRVRYAYFYG